MRLANQQAITAFVAARRPRASFSGPFSLRAENTARTLDAIEALDSRIAGERQILLKKLHAEVPKVNDVEHRRKLIKTQRVVAKGLEVDPSSIRDPLFHLFSEDLQRHNILLQSARSLLQSCRIESRLVFRATLNSLLKDAIFSSCVEYSCPWLIRAYLAHLPTSDEDFSKHERALHDYATRFITKANPLFLYAGLQPAEQNTGTPQSGCCRLTISSSLIYGLEAYVLDRLQDYSDVYVAVCSYTLSDTHYRFLCLHDHDTRIVHLKRSLWLDRLIQHARGSFRLTYGEARAAISGNEVNKRDPAATALLNKLIELGICHLFLLTKPDDLVVALSRRGIIDKKTLDALSIVDKTIVLEKEVPSLARGINALDLPDVAGAAERLYVDSFVKVEIDPYQGLLAAISSDLRVIAPLFHHHDNYLRRRRRMKKFICEYLRGKPGERAPLVDIIAGFLRRDHAYDLGEMDQGDQERLDAVLELHKHKGELSLSDVGLLLKKTALGRFAGTVCFNGPLDVNDGFFYPQNFFPGELRSLARFFDPPAGAAFPDAEDSASETVTNVQVAARLPNNRETTRPLLRSGCSFEPRFRTQFENWIDPSDVLLEVRNNRLCYVHAQTGAHLRFHFLANILADYLSPAFQFLLLGHRDFYHNPFLLPHVELLKLVEKQEMETVPELRYGHVVLRRAESIVSREFLAPVLRGDSIDATLASRKLFTRLIGNNEYYAFYHIVSARSHPTLDSKPRILNINNPLSCLTLRRTINRLQGGDALALSPLRPIETSMPSTDGQPFLTEFMFRIA